MSSFFRLSIGVFFIGAIIGVIFFSIVLYDTNEVFAHGYGKLQYAGCNGRLIPKKDASVPDVSSLVVKYRTDTAGNNKGMVFYSDKIDGRVVAVASYASKVGSIRVLSWEVGGVIRTMYPNKDRVVCERPIVYHKGVKYDLEHMLQTHLRKTRKIA